MKGIRTLFQSTAFEAPAEIGVEDPDGLGATEEAGVESVLFRLDFESRRFTISVLISLQRRCQEIFYLLLDRTNQSSALIIFDS